VGIIGDPVSHSLSPQLHNAAFAALGLDMAYVPLPVRSADVGAAVRGLAALGFRGANVTVPHKGAVLPFLTWLDDDVRLAEAANTIVVDGGALRGYNTDVVGARAAVVGVCGDRLAGEPALLLGAGGAARALALALARLGLRLTVANRTAAAAERLAALVTAAVPGAVADPLPLDDLEAARVREARLIVNATSLGMRGMGKVPDSVVDNVTAEQVVFDLVYTSEGTDLLARARASGAVTIDGLSMLVWQAAAAFELWTGVAAPLRVMHDAVGR